MHHIKRTIRDLEISWGPDRLKWDLFIPKGSPISNRTAMGFDMGTNFARNIKVRHLKTGELVSTSLYSSLEHDLKYYGVRIPAVDIAYNLENGTVASCLAELRMRYPDKEVELSVYPVKVHSIIHQTSQMCWEVGDKIKAFIYS